MKKFIIPFLALVALAQPAGAAESDYTLIVQTQSKSATYYLKKGVVNFKGETGVIVKQLVNYGQRQETGEISSLFDVELDCRKGNRRFKELTMETFKHSFARKRLTTHDLVKLEIASWKKPIPTSIDDVFLNVLCDHFVGVE